MFERSSATAASSTEPVHRRGQATSGSATGGSCRSNARPNARCRDDRRGWTHPGARVRRPARALRRPGVLGSGVVAVTAPRCDHRGRRQLRPHARPRRTRRRGLPHAAVGAGGSDTGRGAHRGRHVPVEHVSGVSRRRRIAAARPQHRVHGRSLGDSTRGDGRGRVFDAASDEQLGRMRTSSPRRSPPAVSASRPRTS